MFQTKTKEMSFILFLKVVVRALAKTMKCFKLTPNFNELVETYYTYFCAVLRFLYPSQAYALPPLPPPPSTSLSTYNLSCARFTLDEVKIRKPTRNTKSESASNRILIVMNKKLARLSSIGRTYSISFNSSNVSIFFLEVSS